MTWSHLRRNWTCWFHSLVELNSIAFVIFHLSMCFITLLSFTTPCIPFSFMIWHITNLISVSFSTTFLSSTDYFYLYTLEMKGNEKLIDNSSEKGKSVNLAEIFSFWKYLLLQAALNFHDQKININTVRVFQFYRSEKGYIKIESITPVTLQILTTSWDKMADDPS